MNSVERGCDSAWASAACDSRLSERRRKAVLVSVRRYGSSECGRGRTNRAMWAVTSDLFSVVVPLCRRSGTAARAGLERDELRSRMSTSACLLGDWEGGSSAWEENEWMWGDEW